MKKVLTFIAGHGSPLLYTAFIWSLLLGGSVLFPSNWISTGIPRFDLLIVVAVTIAYLWIQGIVAAWGNVGNDTGAMLDLIFSMVPVLPIAFHLYGSANIQWDYVAVISGVVLYDVIINTKVIFKIARLTSELAQAGRWNSNSWWRHKKSPELSGLYLLCRFIFLRLQLEAYLQSLWKVSSWWNSYL